MRRARSASIIGLLLLAAACAPPPGAIVDGVAAWLSHDDPQPGIALMSPSEMVAAERRQLLWLLFRAALAIAGVGLLGQAVWRWTRRRRSNGASGEHRRPTP